MIIDLLNKEVTIEELLRFYNANITLIELPKGIDGLIWSYKDIYNIYINKSLSYYKRKKNIIHELAHIELNHLNQIDKSLFAFKIDKYEDETDRYINFLLDQIEGNM